jgi:hypothetical protein
LGLPQLNRRAWRLAQLGLVVSVAFVTSAVGQGLHSAPGLASRRPPSGDGDRLVLRSGETRTGSLTGCGGSACLFNGSAVPRDEIEWIGLSGAIPPMPQVDNPGIDTIFLVGGDVKHETFDTVNTNTVLTDRGSYPRNDVRWIHLASSGQQGGGAATTPTPVAAVTPVIEGGEVTPVPTSAETTPSPTPSITPSPTPTSTPTSSPTPTGPTPTVSPSRHGGHLWSGTIHIHFRQNDPVSWGPGGYSDVKTDIAAHLREYRTPLIRPDTGKAYGTFAALEPEGTEMRTHFESDVQTTVGGTHCQGGGTLELSYGPKASGYGHASALYINRSQADTTPWVGFPIVPGTPRYNVAVSPRFDDHFTVNCTSWSWVGSRENGHREATSSTRDEQFYSVVIGKSPIGGCSGGLEHVCDPEIRTINGESGRMFGSFHNAWEDSDFHNDLEVHWSLCRDDVPCTEQPPEPEKTPCQGPAAQEGLRQACRDQEGLLAKEAQKQWDRYQQSIAEADPHQNAFLEAMAACTAWDVSEMALEGLLSADVASIGLEGEALEELNEFKDSLEAINTMMKAVQGDPMALANEGKLGEFLTATERLKKAIEYFQLANKATPEEFLKHLDDCNAPISDATRQSAQDYLLDMERGFEELEDYNKTVNNMRDKENECLDLQRKAYEACLEYARCQNRPESDCDNLKPPGNWVPPN